MLERENVPPAMSSGVSWFLSPSLWIRFNSMAISNTDFNCKGKTTRFYGRRLLLAITAYLALFDIWYQQSIWCIHSYTNVVVSLVSDHCTLWVGVAVENGVVV